MMKKTTRFQMMEKMI